MPPLRRLLLALIAAASAGAAFAAGAPAAAGSAASADVGVVLVDRFDPARYAGRGAVGLVVPGWGETVTRDAAVRALVSGRVESSLVGRRGSVEALIRLQDRPARDVTIYVALPPAGRRANDRRFPVAVVGGGYQGLLTSRATRIPGLVSITDIAPAAVALAAGERPRMGWTPEPDAQGALGRLDARLSAVRTARKAVIVAVVSWIPLLAFLGWVLRSGWVARGALLVAPAALMLSLVLSALDVRSLEVLAGLHAGLMGPLALVAARYGRALPAVVLAVLAAYCVVLVAFTEVASLAVLGPQPSGGGRFYGTTNKIGTMLLAPVLAGCAAASPVLAVPVAIAALVTVGWSRAGADGGGLLVLGVALAVLALASSRFGLRPRSLAAAVAAVVVAAVGLVALDAVSGGQSHVTDAVAESPSGFGETLVDRLRLSWAGVTDSGDAIAVSVLGALVLLAAAAVSRGRAAPLALLAALVASLVVNDTAVDVLLYGMLGAFALVVWDRVRERDGP